MTLALRPASTVMRLERLGSFHECRLSFMRVLLRRMRDESWRFLDPDWNIGSDGTGHAVYTVDTPTRSYSLVAFAHDLPDKDRSDRVIAEAWDATFALFDGVPSPEDIQRLSENVPLQEAGRISASEITMSRANRSTRAWDHVVDALAKGTQPDAGFLGKIGYLMRTTAVYGSGKFGAVDYSEINDRPEFSSAFQAEMLTVFLIRQFVFDLVNHHAKIRSKDAVLLSDEICRRLGIGNSTGLGMAPFLVNHPNLFHTWIHARETALARVRAVESATTEEIAVFEQKLETAIENAVGWAVDDEVQMGRIKQLLTDLKSALGWIARNPLSETAFPWERLIDWSSTLGLEAQEQLVSLVLEPYGEIVDDLASTMKDSSAKPVAVKGSQTIGALIADIEQYFDWCLECDYTKEADIARFWYVSEEKLEPRLGERFEEDGAELERPLGIGRDVRNLLDTLRELSPDKAVAEFLLEHPEYRRSIQRLETAKQCEYSEIHDNLLCATMRPIDMLRCKLAFFGATRFDPRSDRWVRICMFQNAPLVTDFKTGETVAP